MRSSLVAAVGAVILLSAVSTGAHADPLAEEAQSLLNGMGYAAGPVDGAWGRRSAAALEAFLTDRGDSFDGTLDDEDLVRLREAAPAYEVALRNPGRLFDKNTNGHCSALTTGRFDPSVIDTSSFPAIPAFNDSKSIGTSVQEEARNAWARPLVVLAAAAEWQPEAAEVAKALLMSWADAGAGTGTVIDNRYLGAGNAADYDADAAAPVLDMENAVETGAIALTAAYMLGDVLSADERERVVAWADSLIGKYNMAGGVLDGSSNGVYMSAFAELLRTVASGDADAYRQLVGAYYALLRDRIDDKGAILKNANRGNRGLHYQSIGILATMSLFEIVSAQGSRFPADLEQKLHLAVKFLLDADRDNRAILPYSKEGFNNPARGENPDRFYRGNAEHYWWMLAYISRFPEHENSKRLRALIAKYDTFENVDDAILAALWVPYPVNCYRPFDLSPEALEEANLYVANNYPPVDDGTAATSLGFDAPKTPGAKPISVEGGGVFVKFRNRSFIEFGVVPKGLKVDGEEAPFAPFSVYADFQGDAGVTSDLALLRLVILVEHLAAPESRDANFSTCGELAAGADGSNLRLHIGEAADRNACVLELMAEEDRVVWASTLDGIRQIVAASLDSDARDRLIELYDFMVD